MKLLSKLPTHISAAIDDTAHFHRVSNHHIEDRVVFHLNAVIRISALSSRMIRLKCFRTGKTLANRCFYGSNKILRRNGVLKANAEIVHDLIEIILKERQNAQLIVLSVHESVLLLA